MKEQRVILEPFELIDILECTGQVTANKHGEMRVKGHIQKEKEEEYLQLLTTNLWASVRLYDESGKSQILYTGVVTKGSIEVINGVKALEVEIKTGSYLMDIKRHIRSFQKTGYSYAGMLNSFVGQYANCSYVMMKGKEKSANNFVCQYHETDWQFARRIASYCDTVIYPNYIGTGEKFYVGLPEGQKRENVNLTEYALKQTQKGVCIEGTLREVLDIGDSINIAGRRLLVISRKSEYKRGELYHTYEFAAREEKTDISIYNDLIAGVSLNASVIDIKGTDVMITIDNDENKTLSGQRWFPYATIYSSQDGSGWYCMPEKGDHVRLCFPSNQEGEAYVANAIHLESEDRRRRIKPDNKSIMNKQGKEILLKPDSILITNNKGMSLELSDSKGISVISNKKIVLESDKEIEITSTNANVELVSGQKISLKQGDTTMTLADNLVMHGTKVRLD